MVNTVSPLVFTPKEQASGLGNTAHSLAGPIGSFLVGPENALLNVVLEGAEPGNWDFSPILLYGPSGVGKTHFAIGLAARHHLHHPTAKRILTTGSDFARAFSTAVEIGSLADFRAKYRSAVLLLVDGLEEMISKPPAQLELLHTMDVLQGRSCQVIVTASRPIAELDGVLPGLSSRLSGGLTVPVVRPSADTRRAILVEIASSNGVALPDQVIDVLVDGTADADSPYRTVPELRSAVFDLCSRSRDNPRAIELQTATELITGRRSDEKPSVREITKRVAHYFHFKLSDLTGPSRRKGVVRARGIALYLARSLTGMSYQQLGQEFGGRDHTTTLHACRRILSSLQRDSDVRRAIDEIMKQLNGSIQSGHIHHQK